MGDGKYSKNEGMFGELGIWKEVKVGKEVCISEALKSAWLVVVEGVEEAFICRQGYVKSIKLGRWNTLPRITSWLDPSWDKEKWEIYERKFGAKPWQSLDANSFVRGYIILIISSHLHIHIHWPMSMNQPLCWVLWRDLKETWLLSSSN